jgi:perosamine synthetase
MRRLREHAMSVSAADRHAAGAPMIEEYAETGFNYRMSDLQAAVGLVQLTRLDTLLARRRALARRYRERLADVPGLQLVGDPPFGTTNFQSFWVVLPERLSRDRLLRTMWRRGIAARRGFMAAHLEPAYAHCAHGDLPVTERLTRQSLILPLFHEMTGDQQDRVIAAVRDVACGSPGS